MWKVIRKGLKTWNYADCPKRIAGFFDVIMTGKGLTKICATIH
jgi:bisphosphoglycerate-dependent phosphoglycerate mutase